MCVEIPKWAFLKKSRFILKHYSFLLVNSFHISLPEIPLADTNTNIAKTITPASGNIINQLPKILLVCTHFRKITHLST